jgi:regulator of protease activity HflC (stomatin/prohibitin superfamily)
MQQPVPAKKRFYQETWFQIAAPVVGLVLLYLLTLFAPSTFASWVVDVTAFGMMFLITLALASQFVLPVRTVKERQAAYERLLAYTSGLHGPVVFVRDGQLIGNEEELKRKGVGVILVDGSSAVVLERGRSYSRAHGPGIVFTDSNERLAATFDLRKQSRSQDAQALTKDGIELKASVSVTFALDPGDVASPRDSAEDRDVLKHARITPAFPFNPDSAFKGYYGFAMNDKQEMVKWFDLPIIVATEYFRDLISKHPLDDLFKPKDLQAVPLSALQTRLTDLVQKAQLLKDRGIKVYSVSVGALELPEEVNRQRLRAWAARWQREALLALAKADVETERIKETARAEAQSEMLEHFRDYVQQAFAGGRDESDIAKQQIAQKFVGALNRVASDPVTRTLISGDTMKQLSNLRVWVGLPAEPGSVQLIGKPESEDLSEIVAEDTPEDDEDSRSLIPEDGIESIGRMLYEAEQRDESSGGSGGSV